MPTQGCNLDDEERSRLIGIMLKLVSVSEMETPGSPQFLASEWIVKVDPSRLCPQDPRLIQRYISAVFYYSTEGNEWIECSAPTNLTDPVTIQAANDKCNVAITGGNSQNSNAWLTGSSECTWGGLGCNSGDAIERIEFERNDVGGTIPSELSRLNQLRFLILEEGILTGTLPSSLGNIRTLEEIDLNFNLLRGTIPETFYKLSMLTQLDLNDNELTGTISSSIGQLSKLAFFQIENNQMTGTLPSSLGNLDVLEVATMNSNQFSGVIPSSVCDRVNSTLAVLATDCLGAPGRPSPPYVECPCCTECF